MFHQAFYLTPQPKAPPSHLYPRLQTKMEPVGAVSEAGWNLFNATTSLEESEVMAQLLSPYPCINENIHDRSLQIPLMLWSDHNAGSYSLDSSDSSSYYWPEICSGTSTSNFLSTPSEYESYYLSNSNVAPTMDMDFCITEGEIIPLSPQIVDGHQFEGHIHLKLASSDYLGESSDSISLPDQSSQHKRKLHMGDDKKPTSHDNEKILTENPKKKARASAKLRKGSKKGQKSVEASNEEEINVALNGQSPSCCSSEDDSNDSQELNGSSGESSILEGSETLNQTGKPRGLATNSQSLYARKRREKINERLRILQNLVPNGTKVDISTMLEEAALYVKSLQLQIKLLSSDELWMYAPIAYNGMYIDIDLKTPPSEQ